MKNGLIGYMFQNQLKNWFEKVWWKIKGKFGWKNTTGIPIVVSDKVTTDTVSLRYVKVVKCRRR